ncbi:MAG: hypothetical protein NTU53_17925 [Planctomycetota bacterium]|nr:hypothetical protein [Planctomycetota bacterium]
MSKAAPKVLERVFEARYEKGYRYLDRCGDVMLVLEELLAAETGKVWMPDEVAPKGAKIKCPELDLAVAFDSARMAVIQTPGEIDCPFDVVASLVLSTLVGRLDLRDMTRFGARFIRILGADSAEDAGALAARLAPIQDWPIPTGDGFTVTDCEASVVCDSADGSHGYRYQVRSVAKAESPIEIDDRLKMQPRFLPKDQNKVLLEQLRRRRQRAQDPVAGVLLDYDYYAVRPQKLTPREFLDRAKGLEERILDAIMKRSRQ